MTPEKETQQNQDAEIEQQLAGVLPEGTILDGRYRVKTPIGEGGMGRVYLGLHMLLERDVAVKVLHAHLLEQENALERFKREAQALSALDHPNIAKIYGTGVLASGEPYIVIDFVFGKSCSQIIAEQGKLAPARARTLLAQLLSALAHSHERGIIHRDVKPSNLLISRNEKDEEILQLVDFGIAKSASPDEQKLTRTNALLGSASYMSPEQCASMPCDARSDIYSAGCVFVEMLTGRPPLVSDNPLDIMYKRLHEDVDLTSIGITDATLRKFIEQCLHKNPADRFQTAQDAARALQALPEHLDISGVAEAKNKRTKVLTTVLVSLSAVAISAAGFALCEHKRQGQAVEQRQVALRNLEISYKDMRDRSTQKSNPKERVNLYEGWKQENEKALMEYKPRFSADFYSNYAEALRKLPDRNTEIIRKTAMAYGTAMQLTTDRLECARLHRTVSSFNTVDEIHHLEAAHDIFFQELPSLKSKDKKNLFEICTKLGDHFLRAENYQRAAAYLSEAVKLDTLAGNIYEDRGKIRRNYLEARRNILPADPKTAELAKQLLKLLEDPKIAGREAAKGYIEATETFKNLKLNDQAAKTLETGIHRLEETPEETFADKPTECKRIKYEVLRGLKYALIELWTIDKKYAQAIQLDKSLIEECRKSGSIEELRGALCQQVFLYETAGETKAALDVSLEALTILISKISSVDYELAGKDTSQLLRLSQNLEQFAKYKTICLGLVKQAPSPDVAAGLLCGIGYAEESIKNFNEAIKFYDQAILLDTQPLTLTRCKIAKATALFRCHKLKEARALIEPVLEQKPTPEFNQALAEAYRVSGLIDLAEENFQRAETDFRKSAELMLPNARRERLMLAEVYGYLSLVYCHEKRIPELKQAITSGRSYASTTPPYPEYDAGLYMYLGYASLDVNDLPGSQAAFEKALKHLQSCSSKDTPANHATQAKVVLKLAEIAERSGDKAAQAKLKAQAATLAPVTKP